MNYYEKNKKTCEQIVKLSFWILKKGSEEILACEQGEILWDTIWNYYQQGDLQAEKKSFSQQSIEILVYLMQILECLQSREEILLAAEVDWDDINELYDI